MEKKKSHKQGRDMYTCKSCGNVSTMKNRICSPEKISNVKMH